jgi:ubiquinone/menaquinone biosynthesis C-methylase UbiE
MLVAKLVGPSGKVVGIDRDASSIWRAETRVAAAGLRNVTFKQTDVNQIAGDERFDAAVGRFILMFLPDPSSVLRSVLRLVRPGGVVAFQEPSWIPMLALGARLPLWSKVLSAIHETFLRSGVNTEMGLDLYAAFDYRPNKRMFFAIIFRNAFPRFSDRYFAEFPIQGSLNEF